MDLSGIEFKFRIPRALINLIWIYHKRGKEYNMFAVVLYLMYKWYRDVMVLVAITRL